METAEINDNEHQFGQFFDADELHIKAAVLFNERINASIVKTWKEISESCPTSSDLDLNACLVKALSVVFVGFKEPMQALFAVKKYLENTPKDSYPKRNPNNMEKEQICLTNL